MVDSATSIRVPLDIPRQPDVVEPDPAPPLVWVSVNLPRPARRRNRKLTPPTWIDGLPLFFGKLTIDSATSSKHGLCVGQALDLLGVFKFEEACTVNLALRSDNQMFKFRANCRPLGRSVYIYRHELAHAGFEAGQQVRFTLLDINGKPVTWPVPGTAAPQAEPANIGAPTSTTA